MVSQNSLLYVNTMAGWPMLPSADRLVEALLIRCPVWVSGYDCGPLIRLQS
jgi:hypothetical protein